MSEPKLDPEILGRIPRQILEAAQRIEHWAKENNLSDWRLGGVCSPNRVSPTSHTAHGDDIAIDMFAVEMKRKMVKKRAEGREGWEFTSADTLSSMLHAHVRKGDPLDVANFCMMLWYGRNSIRPESEGDGEHAADCPAAILRDLAKKAGFDECPACGESCSYGPYGREGETQCKYCGKPKGWLTDEAQTPFPGEVIATSEVQVPPMTQKNLLTNAEAVVGNSDWLVFTKVKPVPAQSGYTSEQVASLNEGRLRLLLDEVHAWATSLSIDMDEGGESPHGLDRIVEIADPNYKGEAK